MALILTLLLLNFYPNEDWGATGHRVIAEVANKYLTDNSNEKIIKILNGETLVNASTYADDIKS
ncbi:MAG: S1/P1 nuclease, partial [Flavobacteriaceae bacterium]|nr:S1/P1 nuclease [Flavobacteriaceae bacterium]